MQLKMWLGPLKKKLVFRGMQLYGGYIYTRVLSASKISNNLELQPPRLEKVTRTLNNLKKKFGDMTEEETSNP